MPDEFTGTCAPTSEDNDISTSAPSFTSAAIVNSPTGRGGCVL
jgi:hypothetical protein